MTQRERLDKEEINNGLSSCQNTSKSRPLFKVRCVNNGQLPDFQTLPDSAAPEFTLDLAEMSYVTLNKISLHTGSTVSLHNLTEMYLGYINTELVRGEKISFIANFDF